MAKNTQPIAKRCKALGISPAVMGYAKKNTTRNSNGNFRKKKSEYATQMQEKQKLKFIYGVLEKQFSNYFEEASRRQGQAGENLLQLLECRLDNVVFRLGYASTRRDARQLVSHNHFTVNGKRVNIPSYQVKAGDVIDVVEGSRKIEKFAKLTGADAAVVALPSWLSRETGSLKGVVTKLQRYRLRRSGTPHRRVVLQVSSLFSLPLFTTNLRANYWPQADQGGFL